MQRSRDLQGVIHRERERDPEIGGREAERGGRELENLRRRVLGEGSSEWERGRDGNKGGLFPLAAYLEREIVGPTCY